MKYLCLFLLIGIQCIGQNKKSYFFDENWNAITEKAFRQTEVGNDKFSQFFELDTANVGKVYLFENYGELETKHFEAIRKHLEKLSGKALDISKPIVINYVSAIDPTSRNPATGRINIYDTSDYKGNRKTKKRTDINLLWLQHPANKSEIDRYSKKVTWLFDKDDYIAKTFLEYNCHIGSLIVINPDGSYLAYYCIERAFREIDEIIDRMKNKSLH
ncbi:hypothetical protein OGH69_01175 [Flavobacterium sp. MFBS3-15]|uniref:hypothetical protein n=1 Tax=Flavobacterium sp. MFBS3-15 TaxID=2989816 RepID=UPI00223624AF|nr:hypothetical protein [Flavobacterium sp. MFBS3-15]MCW4467567.1 hypothetical protein [Flavobacterium sp. MFBS3-15]